MCWRNSSNLNAATNPHEKTNELTNAYRLHREHARDKGIKTEQIK